MPTKVIALHLATLNLNTSGCGAKETPLWWILRKPNKAKQKNEASRPRVYKSIFCVCKSCAIHTADKVFFIVNCKCNLSLINE